MIQKLNTHKNEIPEILKGFTDERWENETIYNQFENPKDFMDTIIYNRENAKSDRAKGYIDQGIKAYEKINEKNVNYDVLYEDVANKVKSKLQARGFRTAMLYGNVEFTSENTGMFSKTRAMLGRRDCYYKSSTYDDSKLFHDIYINLSYRYDVSDSVIRDNSYALYALVSALSKVISIRVYVVNHVETDTPTCYSYNLKKFRQNINPNEFLFFTSDSKRTFGWASYEILSDINTSTVGEPNGTVSIANFNLDKQIDEIFTKIKKQKPRLFG